MQVQLVPLGSVPVGPQSWHDAASRSIGRARRLVRQTRYRSAGPSAERTGGGPKPAEEETGSSDPVSKERRSRPRTTGGSRTSVVPLHLSNLREQCAAESTAMAGGYMRGVREVEAQLRRQAGNVTEERTKLERERSHLERMLRSIRTSMSINQRSSEHRRRRPTMAEMERDVADHLLQWEREELTQLKQDLEKMMKESVTQLQVLGESSRQLLSSANERARVLDLLPYSGSVGSNGTTPQSCMRTDPAFTPECKQVLDASVSAVSRSQLLRETIRLKLSSSISRQNAAHRAVNDGLIKKVSETIGLQQRLTVTSAATRNAAFRKQRETNWIRHSHDRAQGPEFSSDVPTREKLTRPLVQVYQRHLGTQLPEARRISQGSAVLRSCLESSEGELLRLQLSRLQLTNNLRGKTAAAQVDESIVRMRRLQLDRRAMPSFLQQGAC